MEGLEVKLTEVVDMLKAGSWVAVGAEFPVGATSRTRIFHHKQPRLRSLGSSKTTQTAGSCILAPGPTMMGNQKSCSLGTWSRWASIVRSCSAFVLVSGVFACIALGREPPDFIRKPRLCSLTGYFHPILEPQQTT